MKHVMFSKTGSTHSVRLFCLAFGVALAVQSAASAGLGLSEKLIVESTPLAKAFPVVAAGRSADLWHDAADFKGVARAVGDLQADIERVTGVKPRVFSAKQSGARPIIIGTLGGNVLIDALVAEGKLDDSDLKGKWESFVITTVQNPLPGVGQALVIAGSDRRGTIYGIYELSEQLGVSPWHWWADVPPQKRFAAYVLPGRYASGEPVVKYRGIFINDEEPAFGPWAREKFGGINSKMYVHMYELILRMRGNYLWPAMWGKSLYQDDPESARLADEYGIVMGASHHEPMTRAHSDWSRGRSGYGNGEWNYATNEEGLRKFWTEGIRRNRDHEVLVTLGMRGDGDEPMVKDGDIPENIALLEKVIADQREIIGREKEVDPTEVPQMWALYKEVNDYYDHGMRIPEDVTLLWCDDNWGNIRRLPTPEERDHPGGAGVYYHFDYVGTPRCYKWVNHNPLPKIWEQMNMAYEYNANRIWIVNVGDLKPMEYPIEFFLRMAWNPAAMPKEKIAEFSRRWAEREFGAEHAEAIADIMARYTKYSAWRKTELLEPATFSFVNYNEADRVDAAWAALVAEAEAISEKLPDTSQDAYFQLVLHPVTALAAVSDLYTAVGRNRLYAEQGRASANDYAEKARGYFKQDQEITDAYHAMNGGKWNHMMAQTHIGYTGWNDPKENIMPDVVELEVRPVAAMGVAVEGSAEAWPKPDRKENELTVELETLSAQALFAPLAVVDESAASGKKAIVWPHDNNSAFTEPADDAAGQVALSFTLSHMADVEFVLRTKMVNANDDSFFYKLNSGKWIMVNEGSTQGFQDKTVETFSNLPAGDHVLKILRREDGALFDRVILTASAGKITGAPAVEKASEPVLPAFDSLKRQKRWIDVFKRGSKDFAFKAAADKPWVKLSIAKGKVGQDQRIWVAIDWETAPAGKGNAKIAIVRTGGERVMIDVNTVKSEEFTPDNVKAFGGLVGATAFAAEDAAENIPAGNVRWEDIPDYGRGVSGMAVFPAVSKSVKPPENAPRLEYPVFIAEAGEVQVDLITGISLQVQPDRGVAVAVSFNDAEPQVVDAFAGQSYDDPAKRGDTSSPAIKNWGTWVKDNARVLSSTHQIDEPGVHTLKVWMVDPGMVLEKVVVHDGNLPESYFGPPAKSIDSPVTPD